MIEFAKRGEKVRSHALGKLPEADLVRRGENRFHFHLTNEGNGNGGGGRQKPVPRLKPERSKRGAAKVAIGA
ncbi:hypothetical protein C5Y97_05040 [Blastopirellula marina]|uniref:Uncharacterized protein n=1 Tax=Blastopirellula marina TaxID=124 RepID=A0A2S8G950_9BACT|nr:hypothetical protein C5Y98_05040 [Blastopirellula marina]PTL45829.1 hypothetical protein C5Y97_05040 [Blastopirellula marina]